MKSADKMTIEEVVEEVILDDVEHQLVGWLISNTDKGVDDSVSIAEQFIKNYRERERAWIKS